MSSQFRTRAIHDPLWRYYVVLAAAYTVVAVIASLTPWQFERPVPDDWIRLWERFPYVVGGRPSWTDFVSNVALFVPWGILVSAVLLYRGSWRARLARSLVVVVLAGLIASLIELLQMLVPDRTVSEFDVGAEIAGAGLGVLVWWFTGPKVSIWLSARQPVNHTERQWDWWLQIYLFVVSLTWLFPFDITIRPNEIIHKLHSDHAVLNPFASLTWERSGHALFIVAIFLPVGVWVATYASRYHAIFQRQKDGRWLVLGITLLLGIGQAMVMSRRTDVLECIAMSQGISVGVFLAVNWRTLRSLSLRQWIPQGSSEEASRQHIAALNIVDARNVMCCYVAVAVAILITLYLAAAAVPETIGISGWDIPTWSPTWLFYVYWLGGLACFAMAPRYPAIGYLVFFTFAYGVVPRSHGASQMLRGLGLLETVIVLGLLCLFLTRRSLKLSSRLSKTILFAAGMYASWSLISAVAMRIDGRMWNAEVAKQCVRIVECAAILLLAASVPSTKRGQWYVSAAMVSVFSLAAILFPSSLYRDHVTATVAAILLPLTIHATVAAPHVSLQIGMMLFCVKLLTVINVGESRSAAGGAVAGVVAYALLSRFRWWIVGVVGMASVPISAISDRLWQSRLGARFQTVIEQRQGWDTGRLELWHGAWSDFRQHPVLGIGPGANAAEFGGAHSSYLSALSETGAVGFLLYLTVWVLTLVLLARLIWRDNQAWQGTFAKAIIASTVVQLVIGLGYSLQNLQLTFILAGWAIALQISVDREAGNQSMK